MLDFRSSQTSHRHLKIAEKIFRNIYAVSDVDMQLKVTVEDELRCFLKLASFLGSICVLQGDCFKEGTF
jgi:hypothetical protein